MDFIFEEDDNITISSFNPDTLYEHFVVLMTSGTSDWLKAATIFFKKMKLIKEKMKISNIAMIPLKLGDLDIDVVNTYNPNAGEQRVGELSYTLNRLSGCMARYTLEEYEKGSKELQEKIQLAIKNPLAIVKGVRPDNFKLYMAFSAGAEMFLSKFSLFPLAIMLRRIDSDDAPAAIAGKVLKQRLDAVAAIDWQNEKNVGLLKTAMAVVGGVSWKHSKVTEESLSFLAKAGVAKHILTKIKKGE
ncbi:nucleocapsid protein N [Tapirape virus]|uniref:Nucleoprotein n=1 Tax=Tapirape virus TaxID=1538456 RepID=A0A088NRF6_9VIRU|nr:nucleocapsid protein N [Tapirape virus]AIN55749.1 nucleocapsid protein N [Tapirape virus]